MNSLAGFSCWDLGSRTLSVLIALFSLISLIIFQQEMNENSSCALDVTTHIWRIFGLVIKKSKTDTYEIDKFSTKYIQLSESKLDSGQNPHYAWRYKSFDRKAVCSFVTYSYATFSHSQPVKTVQAPLCLFVLSRQGPLRFEYRKIQYIHVVSVFLSKFLCSSF